MACLKRLLPVWLFGAKCGGGVTWLFCWRGIMGVGERNGEAAFLWLTA